MAYTNIDDPSAYFQAKTYTGNATDNTPITNDGNSNLQADWIWFKRRSSTENHVLADSTRGVTKWLFSNLTNAEGTSTARLKSFDTNGFTLGDTGSTNQNGANFVAWEWKANGGTTSSNTDGDITSTVQVNQDAGFSIVTDSPSNNTARSIGHGLGVAPQVVIRRARTRVESWRVFHSSAGSTGSLKLNDSSAYNSSTVLFTGVTSSTFGVGTDFSVNGNYNYVSYCFAEKQGYSKFGSYVGNGSSNGPFVYTGFKPAFLIMKRTDSTGNWVMFDTKRDTHNVTKHRLFPNLTNADNTTRNYIDLLSNGFKMRNTDVDHNASGATIIYMAFAENPFVTSTGIPTTA